MYMLICNLKQQYNILNLYIYICIHLKWMWWQLSKLHPPTKTVRLIWMEKLISRPAWGFLWLSLWKELSESNKGRYTPVSTGLFIWTLCAKSVRHTLNLLDCYAVKIIPLLPAQNAIIMLIANQNAILTRCVDFHNSIVTRAISLNLKNEKSPLIEKNSLREITENLHNHRG